MPIHRLISPTAPGFAAIPALRSVSALALTLGWLAVTTACAAAPATEMRGSSPAALSAAEHVPLDAQALESLVGPVALYPDDLLAVVLPAATHPLQIAEASGYLKEVEEAPSLAPDADWDESVVALLNYPQAVELLAGDLDRTWQLGQAVMNQEQELLAAVERLRRQAHTAGNLTSDGRQHVAVSDQGVEIRPADPAVIYVPYYEPRLVTRRQQRPVYHYHPRPCPVYYYPYPAGHSLLTRHSYPFWGVTSAFSIGWQSRNLHFHLLEHRSHPYYGHSYAFRHYRYWQPRLYQQQRQLGYQRYPGYPGARHRADGRWYPDHHYRGVRPLPHRRSWPHPHQADRPDEGAPPAAERQPPRSDSPRLNPRDGVEQRMERARLRRFSTRDERAERLSTLPRSTQQRAAPRAPQPRTERSVETQRAAAAARKARARVERELDRSPSRRRAGRPDRDAVRPR